MISFTSPARLTFESKSFFGNQRTGTWQLQKRKLVATGTKIFLNLSQMRWINSNQGERRVSLKLHVGYEEHL